MTDLMIRRSVEIVVDGQGDQVGQSSSIDQVMQLGEDTFAIAMRLFGGDAQPVDMVSRGYVLLTSVHDVLIFGLSLQENQKLAR
jgi:hypothetical protein